MAASHMSIQFKQFVKSSDSPSTLISCNIKPKTAPRTPAFTSGHDVKKFYENTCVLASSSGPSKTKINEVENPKPKRNSNIKGPVNVNLLMKSVENGDFKSVEQIVENNEDCLNWRDTFGWTPLMVACCAGNQSMVQLLLQWRPNLRASDKKGNTCHDLASARGYKHIVSILDQHVRACRKPVSASPTDDNLATPHFPTFFCEVCKQSVENTSRKSHLSSTVHNFHAASNSKMPTFYGIPESNKGFQILVKAGWNKEEGLGPSGEGHKFPPKTILKQDRAGFGAKRYRARVTHNVEEIERVEKHTLKKQLKVDRLKGQKLERNLRRMLS